MFGRNFQASKNYPTFIFKENSIKHCVYEVGEDWKK